MTKLIGKSETRYINTRSTVARSFYFLSFTITYGISTSSSF